MRIAILLLAALTLNGCGHILGHAKGKQGSGKVIIKTCTVGEFDRIQSGIAGTVIVKIGEKRSVSVEIDDNLVGDIEVEVDGGELEIDTKDDIDATKLVVTITNPTLAGFSLSGAGEGTIEGLNQAEFDLNLSGAGKLKATGSAKKLSANVSGVGELDARDLKADQAEVNLSGTGSAKIFSLTSLDATVSGVGSVKTFGPGKVMSNVSGVGSVEKGD